MTTAQATRLTARAVIEYGLHRERAHHAIASGVLAWIERHEGVKLTKRNKPELVRLAQNLHDANPQPVPDNLKRDFMAGDNEVRLFQYYGTPKLMVGGWYRHDCAYGWALSLGSGECPIVSVDYFRNHNIGYLEPCAQRIADREAQLASDFPERIDAATETFLQARKDLGTLLNQSHESYRLREFLGKMVYDGLELR